MGMGEASQATTLPPRSVVYAQARELFEIADLARECAQAGPQADLPRAVRLLERARAVLGGTPAACNAPGSANVRPSASMPGAGVGPDGTGPGGTPGDALTSAACSAPGGRHDAATSGGISTAGGDSAEWRTP